MRPMENGQLKMEDRESLVFSIPWAQMSNEHGEPPRTRREARPIFHLPYSMFHFP